MNAFAESSSSMDVVEWNSIMCNIFGILMLFNIQVRQDKSDEVALFCQHRSTIFKKYTYLFHYHRRRRRRRRHLRFLSHPLFA